MLTQVDLRLAVPMVTKKPMLQVGAGKEECGGHRTRPLLLLPEPL